MSTTSPATTPATHPHEQLGFVCDAAGDDEPEHAPDFTGQKADQHQ